MFCEHYQSKKKVVVLRRTHYVIILEKHYQDPHIVSETNWALTIPACRQCSRSPITAKTMLSETCSVSSKHETLTSMGGQCYDRGWWEAGLLLICSYELRRLHATHEGHWNIHLKGCICHRQCPNLNQDNIYLNGWLSCFEHVNGQAAILGNLYRMSALLQNLDS